MAIWVGRDGTKKMQEDADRLRTVRLKPGMGMFYKGRHYDAGAVLQVENALAQELVFAGRVQLIDAEALDEAKRRAERLERDRRQAQEQAVAEAATRPAEPMVRCRLRALAGVDGAAILGPNLERLELGQEYELPRSFYLEHLAHRADLVEDPELDELRRRLAALGVPLR